METIYPALSDLRLVHQLVQDWTRRHFPLLSYKRLLSAIEETDDVHDEVTEDEKRWSDWLHLRAYAAPAAEVHPLTQFGLEHQRDVVLQVAVPDLVEVGLAQQHPESFEVILIAGIGDRFEFSEDVIYDINKVARGRQFGNTDIPVWYEFQAERFRPDSDYYAGI